VLPTVGARPERVETGPVNPRTGGPSRAYATRGEDCHRGWGCDHRSGNYYRVW